MSLNIDTRLPATVCASLLNLLVAVLLVDLASADSPHGLAEPFPLANDAGVIDLPRPDMPDGMFDNAFPWWGDFDGDGKSDLLIGQHTFASRAGKQRSRDGSLRIYRNMGQDHEPRLGAPIWFDDLVPTGRIPSG